MHTPDSSGERPEESYSHGGRIIERGTYEAAFELALAAGLKLADRKVHIATPGQPCNLSATLEGSGGVEI
jgi:hypothetical protein